MKATVRVAFISLVKIIIESSYAASSLATRASSLKVAALSTLISISAKSVPDSTCD